MRQRDKLEQAGLRVLAFSKRELTLSMRYLSASLDRLPARMERRTRTIATDSCELLFSPLWLVRVFADDPREVNRLYLHILMHCLFRHVQGAPGRDPELWDLACDMAAESVVDSLDSPVVGGVLSDFRDSWYRTVEGEVGFLTAERVYAYFTAHPQDFYVLEKLKREFTRCDHVFWEREKKDNDDQKKPPASPSRPAEDDWDKEAKRVRTEIETFGPKAGHEAGNLARLLRFVYKERTEYRDFLEHFSVLRETAEVDPDTFDYAYYNYGLTYYGNMPLIEENELREIRRVDELVIAIDTSASCQAKLVERFLTETASLLSARESFFRRVNIHLIECDEQVRKVTTFTDADALRDYAGSFTVEGGMGTDFRPVFSYVSDAMKRGDMRNIRGLVYFTDGYGKYPTDAPPYETAFVFRTDETYEDEHVPDWALKLYLSPQTEPMTE